MELNERQQRILRGEICPYCGRETELVNADKIYSRKGLGMVMMCKPCNAYVGVHESGPNKGKAKGRLAGPSLRSLKIRVHAELDRLWSTPEERERMYKDLSEFLAIPEGVHTYRYVWREDDGKSLSVLSCKQRTIRFENRMA